MKKIFACIFATLGLTSACGQQHFENLSVNDFAKQLDEPGVILLDVRTEAEFKEGHIEGAVNIDQGKSDFLDVSRQKLAKDKTIAVYCRSGRRSANAANRLAEEGYKCINLNGGIMAWMAAQKPVTTDNYEVDVFKTKNGKVVKIHALMHACIRLEFDGKEIEVDPVASLGSKTIDYAAMPKADYIILTHEHPDHFDAKTIKLLSKNSTELVANKRCADMLGIGMAMNNGDTKQLAENITIEAVPAYNTTEGHLQFHPKGRDNGYILTLDGLRIYIAGDTEDIAEMNDVKDIDIAFMPTNQPYTMTALQLIKAAKTVKPKVLFPYHYGQTDVSIIPEMLKDDKIDVRIRHYE